MQLKLIDRRKPESKSETLQPFITNNPTKHQYNRLGFKMHNFYIDTLSYVFLKSRL